MIKKMWVVMGDEIPLIVIKGPKTEAEARKQYADSLHSPEDADEVEFKELTMQLLDQLTDGPEFAECDYEFTLSPGGDC